MADDPDFAKGASGPSDPYAAMRGANPTYLGGSSASASANAGGGTSGIATVTWPGGSSQSGTLTVTHGLGATPTVVQATAHGFSGLGAGGAPTFATISYTSTTFQVIGYTNDGSSPAAASTADVGWTAVP